MKKYTAEEKKAYYAEQKKEIERTLVEGVQAVYTSERYTTYLDTMMKFHQYSANNCLLILMQKPDATRVAGCKDWNDKFHRTIIKGEKAIKILAPIPKKLVLTDIDENGDEVKKEINWMRFKFVPVFDISQTEGQELPTFCDDLKGSVSNYAEIIETLKQIAPVPVYFEDIKDGSHGYYSRSLNKIGIKTGMSEVQTIKTLAHEIANSILHSDEKALPPRHIREVQAESVAYMVCKQIGIDTASYSFEYVAGWANEDPKAITGYMDSIRTTAEDVTSKVASLLRA